MPKISIFIPVYRESKLLPKILTKLLIQNVEKEIFVIIDEPTEFSLEISKKFRDKVNFIINEERIGKANALNNAVKLSSGQILLFLDSDIEIPDDSEFIKKIIEEIKDTDILDIKKEVVRDSFLSKMTYYEYVGFNIGSWLLARFLKRCPSINGSAFAMRRKVFSSLKGFRRTINEDTDIATRAFISGYRFKYTKKVKVYNHVHSSLRDWIKQRRRWSIGTALWLKEWYKPLLKTVISNPQIIIPALLLLFPSLLLFLLSIFVSDLWMYKFFSLIFLFLAIKFNIALPALILITLSITFVRNIYFSFTSFLVFSILFFAFSRKLEFEFKIHEFFVYYFFYSLLNLFITINGFIRVLIFKKKSVPDWKI